MKHLFGEQNGYQASDYFKVPPDLVLDDFLIHILGKHYVIIENYKCIQSFSKECLVVKGKKQKLLIKGTLLLIKYFGEQEVEISGNIQQIEFLEI